MTSRKIKWWWIALLFLTPVGVWAAATGTTANQIKTDVPSAVNMAGVAAAEGTGLAMARADHTHSISGTLPHGNGGTDVTTATDDNVLVGNGSAYQSKALPLCSGVTKALNYDTATNAFSCATISSGGVSRQTFSSSGSSITGTGEVYAAITASFNGTITLPAASTAGQRITVADETGGPFCGSASSAGVNLITLLRAGSDTITLNAPLAAASLTKLMLWAAGGTVQLMSTGSGVWMVTARDGWGVDPKTISGIKGWYDARCGVAIATGVSQWNDLSGAGVNVLQGTGANQPVYTTGGTNNLPMILTGQVGGPGASTYMGSSATINLTSGALSVYAVDHHDWGDNSEPTAAQYGLLWFGGYSAATGAGIIRTWGATNADQANHGYALEGNGWNLSTTPKVTNYQARSSGQYSILVSARIGSTVSDMKINGAPVTTVKVSRKSAVPTYSTQNVYMMQGAQRDGMSLIMFFDASVSDANDALLSDAINQTWRLY